MTSEAMQPEPFGYFRAEPFGWTDCAPTAEGAKALYEHPASGPAWHDAPTVPGFWVLMHESGDGDGFTVELPNFWKDSAEPGERWYGPIPEDKGGA